MEVWKHDENMEVWGYDRIWKKIMVLYKRHDPIKVLKWEHEQVIQSIVTC